MAARAQLGSMLRPELFRTVSLVIDVSFRGRPHSVRDILYSLGFRWVHWTLSTSQEGAGDHPVGCSQLAYSRLLEVNFSSIWVRAYLWFSG
jgi:hypothetical protein